MRYARLIVLGWAFNLKLLSRSAFDGALGAVWPLFFATSAFLMYRVSGDARTLFYASLGASVLGVWSSTSVAASSALQRERRLGTLEVLVAAPVHFAVVLLPKTLAMATIGVYSMAATLLWGRFLFGIGVHIAHPLWFCLAVPATIVSIGMLGFLLSVTVVRYRTAWALGNALEYPVWLVCGFLVPLSLFPAWVRPISWLLAPTWGMRAIREAAAGGSPLLHVGVCVAVGAGYALLGVLLVETVLHVRARARDPLADVTGLRIFFIGGVMSYRALFGWLSPWILIPTFLVAPLFQILLFAYIGRATRLASDEFYVIGNAIQYASLPCLFAMASTIADERSQQTLGAILVTPARRLPLFLGRALPVMTNGVLVAAFALLAGGAMLHVHLPASSLAPIALAIVVSSASCTGLGLVNAAIGLRVRETAVLSNIAFALLLIFCGVNVPLHDLPAWMSTAAQGLPLTHGIEAARKLAAGRSLGSVVPLLGAEALVGLAWGVVGYGLLRFFELQSRVHATLERT